MPCITPSPDCPGTNHVAAIISLLLPQALLKSVRNSQAAILTTNERAQVSTRHEEMRKLHEELQVSHKPD